MIKVLFVCMGNYCRSPTAQGIAEHLIQARGLESQLHVGSAGTHRDHVGHAPATPSMEAAKVCGVSLSHIRARQIGLQDFYLWDYIVAMDAKNIRQLQDLAPKDASAQICLLMSFVAKPPCEEVPDPYYMGGFDQVFSLIEMGVEAMVKKIFPQVGYNAR